MALSFLTSQRGDRLTYVERRLEVKQVVCIIVRAKRSLRNGAIKHQIPFFLGYGSNEREMKVFSPCSGGLDGYRSAWFQAFTMELQTENRSYDEFLFGSAE